MAKRKRKLGPKRKTTIAFDLNKMSHEIRMALLEIGDGIIGELAEAVCEEAKRLAPVLPSTEEIKGPNKRNGDHKTGPIKDSIFAQASANVPGSWLVCSPTWYSHFLEYGTDPHDIVPKKAKVLTWNEVVKNNDGSTDEKRVFTQKVHHPGLRQRPFLRPAADKAEELLQAIIQKRRG